MCELLLMRPHPGFATHSCVGPSVYLYNKPRWTPDPSSSYDALLLLHGPAPAPADSPPGPGITYHSTTGRLWVGAK